MKLWFLRSRKSRKGYRSGEDSSTAGDSLLLEDGTEIWLEDDTPILLESDDE